MRVSIIIFVSTVLLLNGCFNPARIKRECYYLDVEPSNALLEFNDTIVLKINTLIREKINNEDSYIVTYKYEDFNADKKLSYLVIAIFNKINFAILKFDGNGKMLSNQKLNLSDVRVIDFIDNCKNLYPQTVKRDFMGTDDVRCVFSVKNNEDVYYYYYESIGFDCTIPDTENKMKESYGVIKLIKKLSNEGS